ncbi:MAG: O-antigen ligase family protein [Acidobacteria bacterium]|nr:O-antigen ligase family protein [Acidobacteriota bacterium]
MIPWLAAALLGACAALLAFLPDPKFILLAAVLCLAAPLCWWLLLSPARWIPAFFCAALLLPPLPIPIGDSGPHPSIVIAALGIFVGLLHLDQWRMQWDFVSAALCLLLLALLVSVPMALIHSGPVLAGQSLLRILLFGLSLCVFFFERWIAPSDAERVARLLFWAGFAAAGFACLDFYFQWPPPAGFGPQFIWLDTGVYRRAQGLFYEASTLGNLCAFFLVMIAVSLARPLAAPVCRVALAAGAVVFSAALVLSFSRASVLNVAVAATLLIFLNRRRIRLPRAIWILPPLVAAGFLALGRYFGDFLEAYWLRWWASGVYMFSETGGVLSGRLESWNHLAGFLAVNPWHLLFGVGYKTLPYSSVAGRPVIADNMYLSILVETGLVGLAALLIVNVAILRAGWRAARSDNTRSSFFGAWILCFWGGETVQMVSGDLLTYWRVMPLYLWTLAVALRR